jgi:hypothetical protein
MAGFADHRERWQSGLLMPPPVATDVGRSQSSTDGCFSCYALPASASIDFGMFDKHGFISPIGESAPTATGEPSSSPQDGDSFDKIVPPGEGTAAANATSPAPLLSHSAAVTKREPSSTSKRRREAQVHNLSERVRT